jgi:hypothetical protein
MVMWGGDWGLENSGFGCAYDLQGLEVHDAGGGA